jgi:hypothetical protein
VVVSDAVRPSGETPHGTSLLPADLTDDQLDGAPVLDSIDELLIDDLSEDEDEAFAAALESSARPSAAADGHASNPRSGS